MSFREHVENHCFKEERGLKTVMRSPVPPTRKKPKGVYHGSFCMITQNDARVGNRLNDHNPLLSHQKPVVGERKIGAVHALDCDGLAQHGMNFHCTIAGGGVTLFMQTSTVPPSRDLSIGGAGAGAHSKAPKRKRPRWISRHPLRCSATEMIDRNDEW